MPLLKMLHRVAPKYTPEAATRTDRLQLPRCHSLSHLIHAQCSEAAEVNLTLQNLLLHAQHPSQRNPPWSTCVYMVG